MNSVIHRIKHLFKSGKAYIIANKKNPAFYLSLIYYVGLLSIYYINAFHEEYPDEFDNILGGLFILQGDLPYRDFFTHHGSISYFIAAIVALFTGNSFVKFRILYSIILFLGAVGIYSVIQRAVGTDRSRFFLFYMFLLAIASTYFWFHMLLADSVSAYLFIPVFAIVILKIYYNLRFTTNDLIIISLCTSLAVLNSLTYLFVSVIVYAYVLYRYIIQEQKSIVKVHVGNPLVIFAIPYIVYVLYLVLTGSLHDFIYQTIVFNRKYYIYNLPEDDGQGMINPIRYALSIAYTFFNNFYTLLVQVKDFNLGHPINITFAVSYVSALIYFITRRKYTIVLFILGIMIYSNVRSNPLTSSEHDYQSAVYIALALFFIAFLMHKLFEKLDDKIEWSKRVIYTVLFLLLGIYTLYTSVFLFHRFSEKAYKKYMGQAPAIYDYPDIAPIMNTAVENDEYRLIWPFEFEEMMYMNTGRLPTKYHIFIPGMGASPEIREEIIKDLSKNPPHVIWFDKRFFILGRSPEMYGKFFIEFLDKNYTTLYQYRESGTVYTSVAPVNGRVDIETKLYIRNDMIETVAARLQQKGFIKKP